MIKYRGGKSKEIPHLMWHIPRFSGRYIEPFFGGGAMFFHLEPRVAVVSDINARLMSFYAGVRDDFDNLSKELGTLSTLYAENRQQFEAEKRRSPEQKVHDANEDLYYRLRAMYNGVAPKEFSEAALYFFINKTAYSGMIRYNAHGEFNVPFGRYKNLNAALVTGSHSRLLQRTEIRTCDYAEVFNLCNADDFVFLDPPYDCVFSDYGNAPYQDNFTEDAHRRLAADFRNLPCKALMVVGRTPLTEELYAGYIVDEYDKTYAVNIRNRFKASAKHIVITNYRKSWEEDRNCQHNAYPHMETAQLRLFEATERYATHK